MTRSSLLTRLTTASATASTSAIAEIKRKLSRIRRKEVKQAEEAELNKPKPKKRLRWSQQISTKITAALRKWNRDGSKGSAKDQFKKALKELVEIFRRWKQAVSKTARVTRRKLRKRFRKKSSEDDSEEESDDEEPPKQTKKKLISSAESDFEEESDEEESRNQPKGRNQLSTRSKGVQLHAMKAQTKKTLSFRSKKISPAESDESDEEPLTPEHLRYARASERQEPAAGGRGRPVSADGWYRFVPQQESPREEAPLPSPACQTQEATEKETLLPEAIAKGYLRSFPDAPQESSVGKERVSRERPSRPSSAGPPMMVRLSRGSLEEPWGIEFEHTDENNRLAVASIQLGTVAWRWNAEHSWSGLGKLCILPGDELVSVNGSSVRIEDGFNVALNPLVNAVEVVLQFATIPRDENQIEAAKVSSARPISAPSVRPSIRPGSAHGHRKNNHWSARSASTQLNSPSAANMSASNRPWSAPGARTKVRQKLGDFLAERQASSSPGKAFQSPSGSYKGLENMAAESSGQYDDGAFEEEQWNEDEYALGSLDVVDEDYGFDPGAGVSTDAHSECSFVVETKQPLVMYRADSVPGVGRKVVPQSGEVVALFDGPPSTAEICSGVCDHLGAAGIRDLVSLEVVPDDPCKTEGSDIISVSSFKDVREYFPFPGPIRVIVESVAGLALPQNRAMASYTHRALPRPQSSPGGPRVLPSPKGSRLPLGYVAEQRPASALPRLQATLEAPVPFTYLFEQMNPSHTAFIGGKTRLEFPDVITEAGIIEELRRRHLSKSDSTQALVRFWLIFYEEIGKQELVELNSSDLSECLSDFDASTSAGRLPFDLGAEVCLPPKPGLDEGTDENAQAATSSEDNNPTLAVLSNLLAELVRRPAAGGQTDELCERIVALESTVADRIKSLEDQLAAQPPPPPPNTYPLPPAPGSLPAPPMAAPPTLPTLPITEMANKSSTGLDIGQIAHDGVANSQFRASLKPSSPAAIRRGNQTTQARSKSGGLRPGSSKTDVAKPGHRVSKSVASALSTSPDEFQEWPSVIAHDTSHGPYDASHGSITVV